MDLYFSGAEQGMWRELLHANGVRHMSLSFMGLRRRVKHLDRWRIEDKFPDDVKVYLDSGAFTLNKAASKVTEDEAWDHSNAYQSFVAANLDRIEFASEFDAAQLGTRAIVEAREDFWDDLDPGKWMPVWHTDYGINILESMANSYARVGILQDDAGGDLTPLLNRLAGRTELHGIAMTRMQAMKDVRWSSVGSTSWLSPTQYGDTILWSGRELHRYPKKQKDQARKRHRTWLDSQGFDVAAIEADDKTEILRLSIWSWLKYTESISGVATTMPETPSEPTMEQTLPPVAIPFPTVRNDEVETPSGGEYAPEPLMAPRMVLPVMGFTYETVTETGPDGKEIKREDARMAVPSATLLQCDTCFMKDKCPVMTPGSACKYEIPVQIRTPAQADAVRASLLEMQTQRVLRMTMIEQTEGGYADPNLTIEMRGLWKMLSDVAEGNKDSFKLTVEASSPAQAGMISRIFGQDAGDRLADPGPPIDTRTAIEQSGIIDAEIVGEEV